MKRKRLQAAWMLMVLALLAAPSELTALQRIDAVVLESGEDFLYSAVIDPAGEFAYFGTVSFSGQVVKIDLETFERVDAITLESGEDSLTSAVIDPAGEFAYFGTATAPGRVVKIDLETFERVDAVTLDSGEEILRSAVIDPAGDFAYFSTQTFPGRVVKIDLETFERTGAVAMNGDESFLSSAVIDPAGEFAYFGTADVGARVVKIDLATFERVDAITLKAQEDTLFSAVIDPVGEFAYFGTFNAPGRVVKIDLAIFERVDAITLDGGENALFSAVIDPAGELAYFGTETSPGRVVKIGLVAAAPELTFDPTSLDFGDVEVGSTSEAMTSTLENTGDGEATALAFTVPGEGFEADTSGCGPTLPVGGSCPVSVTFTPTASGPTSATLTAESAEGAAADLALTGNGVSETGVLLPVALEVDYQILASDGNGVFEAGETVDVAPAWRNDGSAPLSLLGTAASFTGPDGPDYELPAAAADYGLVNPGDTASCRDTGVCYQMEIGPPGVPRPATHWDTTFDETLSDDTARTWTLHVGDSFVDVPRTSLFYRAVETLLHHGVSGDPLLGRGDLQLLGCTETEFCPAQDTTREQVAVFVLQALEGAGYVPQACVEGETAFGDVPFDSPFCPWIEELASRQVTAGCGEGLYCPAAPVSRAQAAIFLLKTLEGHGYDPPPCTGAFHDVPCPSLFADWIEELFDRGVTAGCGGEPPAYCPANPTTRAQMASFVTRTFGLTLYGP